MRAEIVSVGTELLLGDIIDTNAAYLANVLSEIGVSVYRRVTVGDNMARLVAALKQAAADADVVLTIGGLGPTMDDITREGLAEAFGQTLHQDDAAAERISVFFALRNLELLPSNLRQALAPERGGLIDNPNGTALGVVFESDSKLGIALPGPPSEFIPMVENYVRPMLLARAGSIQVIRSRTLRIAGVGESAVEDRVRDLMLGENPTVAPYAKPAEVHLRITARAANISAAEDLIMVKAAQLRERLGDAVYGEDATTLEEAVVTLLLQAGLTAATAESCTGGLLAKRLTDVPGSSGAFPGGVVAYGNAAKHQLLGVKEETLSLFGAVSRETAEALASGARERFNATFGIGITGVAGPDGGTEEKPVGLVWIALAWGGGEIVEECRFIGQRDSIRWRSSQTALNMLRMQLLQRISAK